jgi:hypothetical protein
LAEPPPERSFRLGPARPDGLKSRIEGQALSGSGAGSEEGKNVTIGIARPRRALGALAVAAGLGFTAGSALAVDGYDIYTVPPPGAGGAVN